MAGNVNLTSTPTGAQESKSVLSGIQVQTAPVYVGNSSYEELVPEDTHDVEVGVYLDGTWNNRANTSARIAYEDREAGLPHDPELANAYIDATSFGNDYSNVSKMEPYYRKQQTDTLLTFGVYIEGVGTENHKKDSIRGGGFGTGSTGVEAKVEKGLKTVASEISNKGVEEINTITIDVFGFSRGAAAARNLVHEVMKPFVAEHDEYVGNGWGATKITVPEKPRHGHLGLALKESGIPVRRLVVRFVGVYDTVSSHGAGVVFSYDNDTAALGLDAIRRAQFTLHLTAYDEHRKNFSLTNINSAATIGRGKEFSLPGVHGDIGGTYLDGAEEKHTFVIGEKDFLLEQGWYREDQIRVKRIGRNSVLKCVRDSLPNTYCRIPLTIMTDFTVEKNLPIDGAGIKGEFPIPGNLDDIKNRIFDYVYNEGPPLVFRTPDELNEDLGNGSINREEYAVQLTDYALLKQTRNQFLHFSAQYGSLTMGPRRRFLSGERYRKIVDG
ncbi:phospholipase effector Tle1 domain-containing protein [Cochleicola gelatinilyticus]|uniref:T6SS Phospholipase effector Tle1-like catalytic domain-containing protein n=1 Tax=Cochleicola gelatinilyticus TaxID=1763537 RepID=A0A167H5B2_9FLAO|nr:DUF2235 domain-containing protein [Cochleicola gelatinilyticus]OAB78232.1 hypothetical protein ULVI_12200 [Cochleicola gelatinilyticus]